MPRVLEILSLSVLSLIINSVYCAGFTHTVTCQQHGEAVLSFHFSFISGAEDLDITLMKMESIRDTKPTVIYVIDKGAELYPTAHYRNRTEIRNDLPSGKLELKLKDVEESDTGIYKCQAANKKNHEEKMIQLYIKLSVKPTEIMKSEGDSVTFRADFSGPRTEVVWKIGEDKLVEVEENYTHYYRLKDRASASFHSGSLTIRDLVESDSGHYSGNILTEGKYQETKFILKVSPSKPEVHYNVTNVAITVYCESNSTGVTYEWRNSSGDLLSTGAVYTAPPETLRINYTVTCIVRNNVSESSSSVTIEDYTPKGKTSWEWNILAKYFNITSFLFFLALIAAFLYKRVWVPCSTRNRNTDNLRSPLPGPYEMVNIDNLQENPMPHKEPQYQKDPTGYAEPGML